MNESCRISNKLFDFFQKHMIINLLYIILKYQKTSRKYLENQSDFIFVCSV
jgi:hypothetical protein